MAKKDSRGRDLKDREIQLADGRYKFSMRIATDSARRRIAGGSCLLTAHRPENATA